jgi:hypothetical protein
MQIHVLLLDLFRYFLPQCIIVYVCTAPKDGHFCVLFISWVLRIYNYVPFLSKYNSYSEFIYIYIYIYILTTEHI